MLENFQNLPIEKRVISEEVTRKELIVPVVDKDKTHHRLLIPPRALPSLLYGGNRIGEHLTTRVSPAVTVHRADLRTSQYESFHQQMMTEVDNSLQEGSDDDTFVGEKRTHTPNRTYHQSGVMNRYVLDGERFQSQDKQDEFTIFRDGSEKTPFYQELVRQAIEIASRYPDAEMDRVFLLTRLVATVDFNTNIALYPSENQTTKISEENMSQRRAWVLNMLLQDEQIRRLNTIQMPVATRSSYVYGVITDPLNTTPRTWGWVRYLNESGMEYTLDPSNLPDTVYPEFWKTDEKNESKIPLDEEDILEILEKTIPKKVAVATK